MVCRVRTRVWCLSMLYTFRPGGGGRRCGPGPAAYHLWGAVSSPRKQALPAPPLVVRHGLADLAGYAPALAQLLTDRKTLGKGRSLAQLLIESLLRAWLSPGLGL